MGHFVLAAWPRGAEPTRVETLRSGAEEAGWSTLLHRPGLWIGGGGPRPPRLEQLHDGRTAVIGDLFARPGAAARRLPGDALERARRLSEGCWGRYVAVLLDDTGVPQALFRDPSGGMDCAVWREADLVFAASSAPRWLVRTMHLDWLPDWERVADILADPVLMTGRLALQRVDALAPGEFRGLQARQPGPLVWTPARTARRRDADPGRASARLRAALDTVVQAAAGRASGVLVEVSGGLDSAVVAASLNAGAAPERVAWWHFWGPYREADERSYARALADRLGVRLEAVRRPEPGGTGELCLDHPPAFRPSASRLDAVYEETQAEACVARALDMVLTGKGGDVALFQLATSAVVADLLSARGPLALAHPASLVMARRMRRSVWAVLCRGLRSGRRPLRRSPNALAARAVRSRRPAVHPWLADVGGLPIGKRIQIAGFAHNLSLHGVSRRSEAADLVHPFLSQPVMEACLATPTYVLTLGGHDRLLARRTFADRLPDEIVLRRSKGELGTYYGRVLAGALEPLRAHLLEGRLAAAGLLDTARVEAALDLDALISTGSYGDIRFLAAVESWAKGWSANPPPWRR